MARTIRKAQIDPAAFVRYLLMDPVGPRDPLPEVHRDLQNHLSAHRLALVELPRDHGKTTQVCLRVLWELGRAPNLRIKIVCASESIAVDRSRFLRRSIEQNPKIRKVFPHLRPSQPWSAPSIAAFGIGAAATGTRAVFGSNPGLRRTRLRLPSVKDSGQPRSWGRGRREKTEVLLAFSDPAGHRMKIAD